MPLIYYDKKILEQYGVSHPALKIDKHHPCYAMTREAVDDKSVFKWNKEQAYQMYKYYCDGYRSSDVVDEFGEEIYESTFRKIVKMSHYVREDRTISDETIQELWNTITMEKKILESIGKEKEDDDS